MVGVVVMVVVVVVVVMRSGRCRLNGKCNSGSGWSGRVVIMVVVFGGSLNAARQVSSKWQVRH